ncbi:MAG: RIP metalloprotease RseP [Muribaculaceae bacterium]|nr:RIP metalloprotease RseP [Muribaculaceae bacterium]
MITTVILFIIIFGIVVISHEFGHFLIGKRNGIRVLEFAVGMGPTLFSFQKGETKYSLKLLPIGGACMFDGEDGMAAENGDRDEHTFLAAGVWARIGTIFAGPFFNFLLAFVFSLILVAFNGADRPVIQKITADSAAEEAGIMAGDEILRMNNERIRLYREVSLISALNQGESMTLQLKRGDEVLDVTLTPRYSERDGRYYIGLSGAGELIQCNPAQVFQYGVYEVRYWVKATYKSLLIMLRGQAKKEDVSGPIGIAQFVGDAYEEVKPYGISSVIFTMMNIVVLLSVNLGILNLLPLPALDGGRLVFLFLEVLRGKPISPEKEGIVHFAGLVVFMILMVFVMYNDIMKLVH